MMRLLLFLCVFILVTSCSDQKQESVSLAQQSFPIVNGKVVTGDDYLVTTMLAYDISEHYGEQAVSWVGEHAQSCSSTLITPNYVLTAAHCICNNESEPVDLNRLRLGMNVYIAQSLSDIRAKYEIEAFFPHPGYVCNIKPFSLKHDIALIKLKESVPISVARPIAPLPPSLAISAMEVESTNGVTVVDVGFGMTHDTADPSDLKHEMISRLYAYCPETDSKTENCDTPIPSRTEYNGKYYYEDFDLEEGFMFTRMEFGSHSSLCQGDSGGPTYLVRNGIPYVAGIHSHVSSYECNEGEVSGSTVVSEHYDDFIRSIVTDLPSDTVEINCSDGMDDNHDGRVDCDDPWCFHLAVCFPEICDDGIDNNNNGKTDCDDEACVSEIVCQPEICDDEIDNNGDEKIDCMDPQCADEIRCQPEICDDKIDNNGDGKIDCEDASCISSLVCQPEICDDKIDNNGNGYTDCGDPGCIEDPVCQAAICDCNDIRCTHAVCIEICDDKIDNNGDGKVDCEDMRCAGVVQCNVEICDDKIDNNGNGFIDCEDSMCVNDIRCQLEICDDKIDNNGDGIIDCADPACANLYVCNPYTLPEQEFRRESACSASVMQTSSVSLWMYLVGLLGLCGLARRRSGHSQK